MPKKEIEEYKKLCGIGTAEIVMPYQDGVFNIGEETFLKKASIPSQCDCDNIKSTDTHDHRCIAIQNKPTKELKKYTESELKKMLMEHELWINSDGKIGQRADFRSVDLRRTDLRYACLRFADLREVNLHRTYLSYSDLRFANFNKAYGAYTDFCYTDLKGAEFVESYFWKADLSGANIFGVNFSGFDCERIICSGVYNYDSSGEHLEELKDESKIEFKSNKEAEEFFNELSKK